MSNVWAEVHSELTNKIRWAVATSAATAGIHLSYRESQDWARSLAGEVLEGIKRMQNHPGFAPWLPTTAPSSTNGSESKVG